MVGLASESEVLYVIIEDIDISKLKHTDSKYLRSDLNDLDGLHIL
jgi:hypothetical protein